MPEQVKNNNYIKDVYNIYNKANENKQSLSDILASYSQISKEHKELNQKLKDILIYLTVH